MQGMIFDIKRYAINDGPGIRTTVFLKGCPLRCQWCHNPESWESDQQSIEKTQILDGQKFKYVEKVGRLMEAEEVLEDIAKDALFYDESGGGITFSGGEPLFQSQFLEQLLVLSKQEGYHTAVDTCGFSSFNNLLRISEFTDLFLYDLKLIDSEKHQEYCNTPNEIIIENMYKLVEKGVKIILRFPVIPGITNTDENINGLKKIMENLYPKINEIHILPFHSIARNKYKRLKLKNKMEGISSMKKEDLAALKKEMEEMGWKVKIGG